MENRSGGLPWSPHTGERHGFANLEALFAFLEEQTGGQPKRQEQPKDISEIEPGM